MTMKDKVDYWLEMADKEIGLLDIAFTKQYIHKIVDMGMMHSFEIDGTGIMFYMIGKEFNGTMAFSESLFYIRKEHRGSLKLVKKYIDKAEKIASEFNCKVVRIGANIKYKDASFIKLLQRWGYGLETVVKEIA